MNNTDELPEFEALLARARQGEPDSIRELLNSYRSVVRAWAQQRMRNKSIGLETASDVTQDVMASAYENFSTFKGTDKGAWHHWLQTILNSTVFDAGRYITRDKREALHLPLDAAFDVAAPQSRPSQRIGRRQELMPTLQRLSRLPSAQGQAVWLRHRDGYKVEEIARIMNRPKEAVSSLIWRGLSALSELRGETGLRQQVATGRLERALTEYLERCDERVPPGMDEFLAKYPDCAIDLRLIVRWMQDLTELAARDSPATS